MVPSETASVLVVRFVPCRTLLEARPLATVVLTAKTSLRTLPSMLIDSAAQSGAYFSSALRSSNMRGAPSREADDTVQPLPVRLTTTTSSPMAAPRRSTLRVKASESAVCAIAATGTVRSARMNASRRPGFVMPVEYKPPPRGRNRPRTSP